MKKQIFTKTLVFLIALVIISSSLAVFAFAAEGEYVDWEVYDGGKTLIGDGKVYKECYVGFYMSPVYIYQYNDRVTLEDREGYYSNGECLVRSNEANSDIVWVKHKTGNRIFVATKEAREHFENFKNGKEQIFNLNEYHDDIDAYSYLSDEFVQRLDTARTSGAKTISVDGATLMEMPCYYVIARDTYLVLMYQYGAIYRFDDGFYYLNFKSLGNEQVNQRGDLLLTSGNVTLTRIEGALDTELKNRIDSLEQVYGPTIEYETIEDVYDYSGVSFTLPFWPSYVAVCFGIPFAFAIVGVCFANAKKFGKQKYWYVLTAVSGVWIFISFMLTLLIA